MGFPWSDVHLLSGSVTWKSLGPLVLSTIGCFGWLLFEKQMKEPLSHLAQLQVLIPKRTSCIQLQHRHDGFHTAVIPDKKLR